VTKNPLSPTASILGLFVSRAKTVIYNGYEIETGIFKEPVTERLSLTKLNLDGDEQADLTVHGGVDKAVYAYPSEHYPFWRKEMPDVEFPWGTFGENLTTEGLLESKVCIGDEFRIGTAIIRVSQPRVPCYKLAMKVDRPEILKRFMKSGKSGIYFSVVQEGVLGVGDKFEYLRSDEHQITVSDVTLLFKRDYSDPVLFNRIMRSNLAPQMKHFVARAFPPG
jgi:MOSC domain-containing protein YiiM